MEYLSKSLKRLWDITKRNPLGNKISLSNLLNVKYNRFQSQWKPMSFLVQSENFRTTHSYSKLPCLNQYYNYKYWKHKSSSDSYDRMSLTWGLLPISFLIVAGCYDGMDINGKYIVAKEI